jgi:hypothetical protein
MKNYKRVTISMLKSEHLELKAKARAKNVALSRMLVENSLTKKTN